MITLVPELSKLEPFDGKHFRRWLQKLMFVLETINFSYVLTEPKSYENDKLHMNLLRLGRVRLGTKPIKFARTIF